MTAKRLRAGFPKARIINAYGPTEATCFVTAVEITDEMLQKDYLPVGKVSDSAVDIFIRDGEIVLRGESVFAGYLHSQPMALSQKETHTYQTGDIGEIKDGLLYCYGRKDSQIKYLGYRIELGDIEQNLLRLPGIEGAVVLAKYKEGTGIVKMIKAFVQTREDISEEEIKKDYDLIESGLLDSYAFIELFFRLEEEGYTLQPTRIDLECLRTPGGIEKLLQNDIPLPIYQKL